MNPLIEKFWNDAGYKVTYVFPSPRTPRSRWRCSWYLEKDGHRYLAGLSQDPNKLQPTSDKCYYYIINNRQYLEEDMLKIIKLKDFI